MSTPLKVFCCYAREDQEMLVQLKKHLALLKRQGKITIWSDTNLNAGVEWKKELHKHLESADIILLLISPNFMNSDYCYNTEMERAIARHNEDSAVVIPILLSSTFYENAPFAKLEIIPTKEKPVTQWSDWDDAFYDITKHINQVISAFSSQHMLTETKTRFTADSKHADVLVVKNVVEPEKFSQRMGIPQVNTTLQRDSMDVKLRNTLWNASYDRLRWGTNSYAAKKFAEQIWQYCFNRLLNELSSLSVDGLFNSIREHYFTLEWHEVYDFLDYVANHLEYLDDSTRFVDACNSVLKRELSAYRFVEKKLTLMTSDQELVSADENYPGANESQK
jgi:hypothetical protein